MTFGQHVSATINCQKMADTLLRLRRDENEAEFVSIGCKAICENGPNVPTLDAASMVNSWWRCSLNDPHEWRRNVALTLERIRQGWGTR